MSTTAPIHDVRMDRLLAREHVLRMLALAASDPAAERFALILDTEFQELACAAARHLAGDPAARPALLAPGEQAPEGLDLTALVEALREPRQKLVKDHTRVFGLVVSKECPPYEVQYCPQTFSVYRSQRMADIAGFYRAFGVAAGRDVPERVDHIACELEFLAWLVAKERYARSHEGEKWTERAEICRDAQCGFLTEHLAWWVPAFAQALHDRTRALESLPPLPAALAPALAALIPAERSWLGVEPPNLLVQPRPDEDDVEGGCAACPS